jgi:hypothetical protein
LRRAAGLARWRCSKCSQRDNNPYL